MCYCFVLILLYAVCYESGLILISVCGKSPHPPHSIRNSSSVICGTEMTVNWGASGLLRCTVWLLFQCYDVEHEHLFPNPSPIFVNFRSQERRTLHYTSAGRQVGAFETKRMKHRSFLPLPNRHVCLCRVCSGAGGTKIFSQRNREREKVRTLFPAEMVPVRTWF